jgi:hypothetical protein
MYIADNWNNRIRIVRTNGIIATVAGGGDGTFLGDGGAATNASLNAPAGIALDAEDNLYIADSQNNRIRKVDANGIITTVAGNGSFGYSGDGGAPTNALLRAPQGVALDAWGNLYIADTFSSHIRKALTVGYPMLVLPNVSTNNAGDYTVVITSPYGSVTSLVATLTIKVPPSITNGIGNLTVPSGANACFTVSATGSGPLTYQWQFNGTNIAGATASTLNLTNTPTASAGAYNVLITGPAGTTSASALLTVGTILGVIQNADQVILNWTGPWALQSATNAGGPYADVPGAASPVTNLISAGPRQFFRLRSAATNALTAIGSSPGGFVLSASGVPGYNYAIEISTNLTDWTAIQTNPVPFQFIDVNASNYPVRFYRTVLVR